MYSLRYCLNLSWSATFAGCKQFPPWQAQEGLRAANDRFSEEVIRMNTDVANAEDALEKYMKAGK